MKKRQKADFATVVLRAVRAYIIKKDDNLTVIRSNYKLLAEYTITHKRFTGGLSMAILDGYLCVQGIKLDLSDPDLHFEAEVLKIAQGYFSR